GRRPILMLKSRFVPVLELRSAWSPPFMAFRIVRVMDGVAMGGRWGVASSLARETIPDRSRGLMSGIFPAGDPCGYLFASVIFGL
ncbi:MFS transporter, partial [Salmonella enterica subsp. enterica serovar Infantis]